MIPNSANQKRCQCHICLPFGEYDMYGPHPEFPDQYPKDFWPLGHPHERNLAMQKYMLIDVTHRPNISFIDVAGMREVALLGRIRQAEGKAVVAPPLEGRGFSQFKLEELQYLFWNSTQQAPGGDYAVLVQSLREFAETIPPNDSRAEDLEAEVRRLFPNENPNTMTTGASTNPTPATPKTPRAPSQPGNRPPSTSTTGKVWDIADHVLASSGETDLKRARPLIIKACTDAGINEATAATQYSKWKAAKTASAAA